MESHFNEEEFQRLLKLLDDTTPLDHNDPFVLFLKNMGIKKGIIPVKVQDLIKLYKNISVEHAIKLCANFLEVQWVKAIPYFNINKKIVNKTKPFVTHIQKAKFEYFLEQNALMPGNYDVSIQIFYNYYDTWCYETRKNNQLTKKQFNRVVRHYFEKNRNNVKLNKDITNYLKQGDVAIWRREKNAKKEKA